MSKTTAPQENLKWDFTVLATMVYAQLKGLYNFLSETAQKYLLLTDTLRLFTTLNMWNVLSLLKCFIFFHRSNKILHIGPSFSSFLLKSSTIPEASKI
jgi:hypothetical protein